MIGCGDAVVRLELQGGIGTSVDRCGEGVVIPVGWYSCRRCQQQPIWMLGLGRMELCDLKVCS